MDSLALIVDESCQDNHLLLNPRMSAEAQKALSSLAQSAQETLQLKQHIWMATSGSTASSESAVKLVALSQKALMASARAVNDFAQVTTKDIWAQVLPSFHVGGLGIYIRSYVSGSALVNILKDQPWDAQRFHAEVTDAQCTLVSLVPTQVYDLVAQNLLAPKRVRAVFVGGGKLESGLYHKARSLGWPLLPSYGMTETASMIFCSPLKSLLKKEMPQLECLSHAQVKLSPEGLICVKGDSLLSCYAQRQEGEVKVWSPLQEGWFVTEDRGELREQGLHILGRAQDYIKIGGESVNVAHLRSVLETCAISTDPAWASQVVLLDMPSERLGAEIQVVSALSEKETDSLIACYSQKVMPFEKVRKVYYNQEIPRSPLGKVLWAELRKRL